MRPENTLLEEVRPLAMARERRLLDGIDEARFKKDLDRLMHNADAMLMSVESSTLENWAYYMKGEVRAQARVIQGSGPWTPELPGAWFIADISI